MGITTFVSRIGLLILVFIFSASALAQNTRPQITPNDTLISPRLLPENRLQFSIYAPEAKTVRLVAGDIPNIGGGKELTKLENGVWEVTVGPIDPGAYRYQFNVDGVAVINPRSASISESNMNVWSLVYIPGADFMDTKDVPHGAISEVTYYSKSLQRFRRMHVYTPPGYELSKTKYPIFYLLHGAFDCDDAWSTIGRAGFILDNLIAAKKAVPMIVVMPAGHTGPFRWGQPIADARMDAFQQDFVNDVMPYIETHYRVYADRPHRALAGLSMGGAQTLNIAFDHLEKFSYIGVYSSGIFTITGRGFDGTPIPGPTWEEQHQAALDNVELKKGIKLVWFATGKEDFLLETSRLTVDMLKKHGFNVVYNETEGGHTWINWRNYLYDFSQLLFR
ncbi:MAG: alpha/beta hydrolase-fold protein [candidate division KSB1 bacterium]|nr:alpha/beta hydrolase-fold protein [candidate division KSB1 bacterium]